MYFDKIVTGHIKWMIEKVEKKTWAKTCGRLAHSPFPNLKSSHKANTFEAEKKNVVAENNLK